MRTSAEVRALMASTWDLRCLPMLEEYAERLERDERTAQEPQAPPATLRSTRYEIASKLEEWAAKIPVYRLDDLDAVNRVALLRNAAKELRKEANRG